MAQLRRPADPSHEIVQTPHGRIAAADWDSPSTWVVAYPDESVRIFTRQEFLDGDPFDGSFDALIVENAHLIERNGFSVAQVYDAKELAAWNPSVPVYLSSGRMAWKYAVYTKGDKTDDASGLRRYLEDRPEQVRCLKRFRSATPIDKQEWEWRDDLRDDISRMFGSLRTGWSLMIKEKGKKPERDIPQIVHCREQILKVWDEIPEDTRDFFDLKIGQQGEFKGEVRLGKLMRVMAAYCLVYDDHGNLRTNPQGKFVGVNTLLYKVVGLSHRSMPNIIRGNLMTHIVAKKHTLDGKELARLEKEIIEGRLTPKERSANLKKQREIHRAIAETRNEVTRQIRTMIQLLRKAAETP